MAANFRLTSTQLECKNKASESLHTQLAKAYWYSLRTAQGNSSVPCRMPWRACQDSNGNNSAEVPKRPAVRASNTQTRVQ